MITAVLFDVDGVLRRWDPELIAAAERDHGLPPGSLDRTAFAEPSLTAAVTGHLTDAQWRADIAARLAAAADVPAHRATAAVAQWSTSVGILDPEVMTLIRDQRRLRRVTLVSNATDRLQTDLAALGVLDQVDGVYNSSTLGLAKPDPALFTAVCADLGSPPQDCAFLDDTPGHVRAAREVGLRAHHFTTAAHARSFLHSLETAARDG